MKFLLENALLCPHLGVATLLLEKGFSAKISLETLNFFILNQGRNIDPSLSKHILSLAWKFYPESVKNIIWR